MAHACYCWCGIVVRYPGWGIVVRYPGVVSLCVTLVRYPRGRGAKSKNIRLLSTFANMVYQTHLATEAEADT